MSRLLMMPLIFGLFVSSHGSLPQDRQTERQLAELRDYTRKLELRIDALQRIVLEQNGAVTVRGTTLDLTGDKNVTLTAGEAFSMSVQKDMRVAVGKRMFFDVDDEVVIKTGKASLSMKKTGDITLKGGNIFIHGENVDVKGSKSPVMKGSKIREN